jgi:Fe-S-cluster containining protein
MPNGKPAGVRCVQLTADLRCAIFGLPQRPAICNTFRPSEEMCGDGARAALDYLAALENATLVTVG